MYAVYCLSHIIDIDIERNIGVHANIPVLFLIVLCPLFLFCTVKVLLVTQC